MKLWSLARPLLFVALILTVSCSSSHTGPGTEKGNTALSIVGSDTNKTVIDIEDYKGKVLVIDFWATWCPPCREKVPSLIKAQEKYGDKGVQVLGISLDRGLSALTDFEESEGLNYPSIYYGADDIAKDYKIRSIPTILILNKEGVITYRGHRPNLDKEIEKALNN